MFSTMSISRAPSPTAFAVSTILVPVVLAPSGNPTTAHTFAAEPSNSRATTRAQYGFTHTLAKPYSRASPQILLISAPVASGFNNVWSINPAICFFSPDIFSVYPTTCNYQNNGRSRDVFHRRKRRQCRGTGEFRDHPCLLRQRPLSRADLRIRHRDHHSS